EPFGPAFALPDLAGDTVTLARFRGKVTLVNFWASWCDPCREEFPHMAELYHEFDRKDFEIAGVSDDVDSGLMLAFARKYRPPLPAPRHYRHRPRHRRHAGAAVGAGVAGARRPGHLRVLRQYGGRKRVPERRRDPASRWQALDARRGRAAPAQAAARGGARYA